MHFTTPEELATLDLSRRNLKLGEYGLTALSLDQLEELGLYKNQLRGATHGIGIPYPSGRIGNVRLGGNPDSKYLNLPGHGGVYWLSHGTEPEHLVITEGEFKAMLIHKALVKEGLHAVVVGLGGVDNWSGRRERRPMLKALADLVGATKQTTIVFDYDGDDRVNDIFKGTPKPEVLRAERRLYASLMAMGHKVKVSRIGLFNKQERGMKFAIDDHLLRGGSLGEVLDRARPYPTELETLDETVAFAQSAYGFYQGEILRLSDAQTMKFGDAVRVWGGTLSRMDEDRERQVNPFQIFHTDSRTVRVEQFTYSAEHPFGYMGNGVYNLFRMWNPGVDGDWSPWTSLVDRVLRGLDLEKEYFHDWVAYIVQNPGMKNYTYLAVVSPENGSGKSLICETVMKMLGHAGIELGGEALFSKNNLLLEGKVLVLANELSSDKSKHVNEFKAMVTSETIRMEEKWKAARAVPNILNFMVTSNEISPVLVDRHSRRDVIIRLRPNTRDELLELNKLGCEFAQWRDHGGLAIIRRFYETRDISKYNPKGRAPETEGLAQAREVSKSDAMIHAEAVEEFIKEFGLPIVLAKEHIELLCGGDVNSNQVGRILTKQLGGGRQIKIQRRGNKGTVWCKVFGDISNENKSELLEQVEKALGIC